MPGSDVPQWRHEPPSAGSIVRPGNSFSSGSATAVVAPPEERTITVSKIAAYRAALTANRSLFDRWGTRRLSPFPKPAVARLAHSAGFAQQPFELALEFRNQRYHFRDLFVAEKF